MKASSKLNLIDLSITYKKCFLDNFIQSVVEGDDGEQQPKPSNHFRHYWILQKQHYSNHMEPDIQQHVYQ